LTADFVECIWSLHVKQRYHVMADSNCFLTEKPTN
jgi:hypothetical protein